MTNRIDLYDDHAKYFNYINQLYHDIHHRVTITPMVLLDQDNFADFFHFCQKRLNRAIIDKDMKKTSARNLKEDSHDELNA